MAFWELTHSGCMHVLQLTHLKSDAYHFWFNLTTSKVQGKRAG